MQSSEICAVVCVKERSVKEYLNGLVKLNECLGAISVTSLCNSLHYWSYIESAVLTDVQVGIEKDNILQLLDGYNNYDPKIKRILYKALWWFRSFKHSSLSGQDSPSSFAHYIGLWNSFENIVKAINVINPIKRKSEVEKNEYLELYLKNLNSNITLKDINHLYKECFEPGIRPQILNSLHYCFGEQFGDEFFNKIYSQSVDNGFYFIRNMIDHGIFIESDFEHSKKVEIAIKDFEMMLNNMFRKIFGLSQIS